LKILLVEVVWVDSPEVRLSKVTMIAIDSKPSCGTSNPS